MQLERILQKHGFGTRKGCRSLIRQERVGVNGVICDDPFADVATTDLVFTVDGVEWPYCEFASLLLYKPAGYECSRKPQHHPSVLELLPLPLRERGVQPHDWVLVHDAARCLLQPAWVDRLIDACEPDEVGGLLALPLADTLKQAGSGEAAGRVAATVDRSGKWAAQTPQMFRYEVLQSALQSCQQVTDEASAVESLGHQPKLVQGDATNLKVTYPADLMLAAMILRGRK